MDVVTNTTTNYENKALLSTKLFLVFWYSRIEKNLEIIGLKLSEVDVCHTSIGVCHLSNVKWRALKLLTWTINSNFLELISFEIFIFKGFKNSTNVKKSIYSQYEENIFLWYVYINSAYL